VPIPALHSRHWCRANDPAKPGRWPGTNDVGACRGQFRFSWLFVGFITIGDEANEFINPNPNTHTGYPGFLRAVGLWAAGDRWGATAVRGSGRPSRRRRRVNRHLRRDGKMLSFYVIINYYYVCFMLFFMGMCGWW